MATVSLAVQSRTETGKGAGRRMRAAGNIPAVLYGVGLDAPQMISINSRDLRAALSTKAGSRVILRLAIDGSEAAKHVALLKELQRHPVTHEYEHADLISIDLNQPVEVHLPIHAQGTPIGVKLESGILEWARRDVLVRVLPTAIPEALDLDISGLHLGQSVHVSDLSSEGFEILDELDQTICSVKSTRLMEEPTAAEGEAEAGAEAAAEGDGEETPAEAE